MLVLMRTLDFNNVETCLPVSPISECRKRKNETLGGHCEIPLKLVITNLIMSLKLHEV